MCMLINQTIKILQEVNDVTIHKTRPLISLTSSCILITENRAWLSGIIEMLAAKPLDALLIVASSLSEETSAKFVWGKE